MRSMMSENEMLLRMSIFLDRRLIPLKREVEDIKKSIKEIRGEETDIKSRDGADVFLNLQDCTEGKHDLDMVQVLTDWMHRLDGIQEELNILQKAVAESGKRIEKLEQRDSVV